MAAFDTPPPRVITAPVILRGHLRYAIERAAGLFSLVVLNALRRGLRAAPDVGSIGAPIIDAGRGAAIALDRGVVLNSSNNRYHLNMAAPAKLLADRPGATIEVGARTRINGACVHSWERVSIGEDCLIAAGVQIMDANGYALCADNPSERLYRADAPRPVRIGDAVWIGAKVIVLPGSSIGNGSVIGAGSIVSGDIPSGVIAAGQPAKVIRAL